MSLSTVCSPFSSCPSTPPSHSFPYFSPLLTSLAIFSVSSSHPGLLHFPLLLCLLWSRPAPTNVSVSQGSVLDLAFLSSPHSMCLPCSVSFTSSVYIPLDNTNLSSLGFRLKTYLPNGHHFFCVPQVTLEMLHYTTPGDSVYWVSSIQNILIS